MMKEDDGKREKSILLSFTAPHCFSLPARFTEGCWEEEIQTFE